MSQSTFFSIFLEDPLPSNIFCSGSLIKNDQSGELALYDLTKLKDNNNNNNNNNNNTAKADTDQPWQHTVRLLGNNSSSSSTTTTTTPPTAPFFPSGLFHADQRPCTNEIVIGTFGTDVHVVRIRPSSAAAAAASEDEASMDVDGDDAMIDDDDGNADDDAMTTNLKTETRGTTQPPPCWDIEHAYELAGHSASIPAVRVVGDIAVTSSFDGCVRLFNLPPAQNTTTTDDNTLDSGQSPPPPEHHHHQHQQQRHRRQTIPKVHPSRTLVEDPAHAGLPPFTDETRGVCGLALATDASRIVTGGNDMQIKAWDSETGRLTLRLLGSQGWLWWVSGLDPALNEVMSGGTDGCCRVWDLRCGQQTACVNFTQQHGDTIYPVGSVEASADGTYLVAGCFDRNVYVADRRSSRVMYPLRPLEGVHEDRVARVTVHGDHVISSGFDGRIGVWEFK